MVIDVPRRSARPPLGERSTPPGNPERRGIPGVLIHGRFDLGCPLQNTWQLAQTWPDARLVVVDDSGHTGSSTVAKAVPAALDGFAS